MHFQNPWGALGFLLVPVLVILYLLKQRYREEKVPSAYLWQKAANQWEASRPWQRWRKSLLFFLQLIILLSLILAFMHPVWESKGMGENTVIVLDLSMSMQAEEKGRTRLESAKEEISRMIEEMHSGGEMSIVLSGAKNELLIMKSSSKAELKSNLDKLSPQYGSSALVEAVQLAKSIQSEDENEVIYLFTDQSIQMTDEKVMVRNLALGAPNMALGSLSYAHNSVDDTLSILGLVHNYSAAKTATVELWCDDELMDVKDVSFGEETQANVLFEGVSPQAARVMLAISQEDALMADNYAYGVITDEENYRLLLQTEQNVFLEKAILLRDDIELYKSNPSEELPLEQYDLIIGDGWNKETLPQGQDIWLINPETENDWITTVESEVMSLSVSATELAQNLFSHVDINAVGFAKVQGIEAKDAAALPLVYNGDSVLVLAQEGSLEKRLVFGFDFHNSNLPMMKDFPILVQNILSWYLPAKGSQTTQITAHQAIPVVLDREAESCSVVLPDGTQADAGQQQFSGTDVPGFYRIQQYDAADGLLSESDFAVNTDSGEAESNLYTAPRGGDSQGEGQEGAFRRSSYILPLLAMLALLVMLIEWWVYNRGN